MLNLGMLYFNSDRGLTVPDVLNPIIVAENPQSLGYRLVDAAGTNFNRMFNFPKIETGDFARLQRHHDDLSFSFSLRQSSSETLQIRNQDKKRSGQLRRGGVSLMPASSTARLQGRSLQSNCFSFDETSAAYIQARFEAIRGQGRQPERAGSVRAWAPPRYRRRHRNRDRPPHLPRHRDYGLPDEWRTYRSGATDGRPCERGDHRAL